MFACDRDSQMSVIFKSPLFRFPETGGWGLGPVILA